MLPSQKRKRLVAESLSHVMRGFELTDRGTSNRANYINHFIAVKASPAGRKLRGTLLPQDWEKAAQGTLGFTHSQNQQIRTWIAQRSRR
jgi:hypothetical protein